MEGMEDAAVLPDFCETAMWGGGGGAWGNLGIKERKKWIFDFRQISETPSFYTKGGGCPDIPGDLRQRDLAWISEEPVCRPAGIDQRCDIFGQEDCGLGRRGFFLFQLVGLERPKKHGQIGAGRRAEIYAGDEIWHFFHHRRQCRNPGALSAEMWLLFDTRMELPLFEQCQNEICIVKWECFGE